MISFFQFFLKSILNLKKKVYNKFSSFELNAKMAE